MSPTPFEHRVRVRYAETDQMGVAHHASYLSYLEEARTRMMAARGCSYAQLEKRGIGLPIRRLEMRYRTSATFDQELLIRTRIARLGAASVRFDYEIERPADGGRIASGWTELACIALDQPDRPVLPLPDDIRGLLAPD